MSKRGTYAGSVSGEADGGCQEETVGGCSGRKKDSGIIEGRKAGGKLKALLKGVGISVRRPAIFSFIQCTKEDQKSFRVSGLVVKHVALDKKMHDEQHLVVIWLL